VPTSRKSGAYKSTPPIRLYGADRKNFTFFISYFRCVLNVVFFLLGDSPASEFYVLTFRNTSGMLDNVDW